MLSFSLGVCAFRFCYVRSHSSFSFFGYLLMIGAKNKVIHTYFYLSLSVYVYFFMNEIHFFSFWCLFCYEQSHSIFLLIGALLLLKSFIHILVCSIFAMNEVIHFFPF